MEAKLRMLVFLSGILYLAASSRGCSPASTRYRTYRVNRVAQGKTEGETSQDLQPEPKRFRDETGCSFDLDRNFPDHPPHIVSEGVIVQPELQNGRRVITLAENQHVTIACEGNVISTFNSEFVNATCHSGSLIVGDQSYPYSSLGCDSKIKPTIRENGNCGPEDDGTTVEIGWKVWDAWLNQITVCHNPSQSSSYYAVHTLIGKSISAIQTSHGRPSFRKGGYFKNFDINRAYKDQYVTAKLILKTSVDKFFDEENVPGGKYLAKGHLSPKADFINQGSQDATMYYVNVLPQWQQINNGFWRKMENSIREKAAGGRTNLTIYTGGFGILTLSSDEGCQEMLYLGPDPGTEDQVPVPKFFWKVVLDPANQVAIAFVTINDPYKTALEEGDIICEDKCNSISWIDQDNRLEFHQGYTYCCTVQDLKNAVPYAPDINLPLLV